MKRKLVTVLDAEAKAIGRMFPAIDPGLVKFIQQLTGCELRDVPQELDKWMRTVAIGSGI
jgi:hypothetical protein